MVDVGRVNELRMDNGLVKVGVVLEVLEAVVLAEVEIVSVLADDNSN